MTHARKTDGNHKPIITALRGVGYTVDDTHALGDGFPDLIVWTKTIPSIAVPMEAKMPGEWLNEVEEEWWKRHFWCLKAIVRTQEEAIAFMQMADRTVMVVGYV